MRLPALINLAGIVRAFAKGQKLKEAVEQS